MCVSPRVRQADHHQPVLSALVAYDHHQPVLSALVALALSHALEYSSPRLHMMASVHACAQLCAGRLDG